MSGELSRDDACAHFSSLYRHWPSLARQGQCPRTPFLRRQRWTPRFGPVTAGRPMTPPAFKFALLAARPVMITPCGAVMRKVPSVSSWGIAGRDHRVREAHVSASPAAAARRVVMMDVAAPVVLVGARGPACPRESAVTERVAFVSVGRMPAAGPAVRVMPSASVWRQMACAVSRIARARPVAPMVAVATVGPARAAWCAR